MKPQHIVLSTLLVFTISPALFAAGHFKKMDECSLIYSDSKSEEPITVGIGDSFLNIQNANKLITKAPGQFTFFYGNSSITITANAAKQEEIIESFIDCSEVAD